MRYRNTSFHDISGPMQAKTLPTAKNLATHTNILMDASEDCKVQFVYAYVKQQSELVAKQSDVEVLRDIRTSDDGGKKKHKKVHSMKAKDGSKLDEDPRWVLHGQVIRFPFSAYPH